MTKDERLRVAVVGLRIHAGGLEPDGNHGLIKSFHAQKEARVVAYCEWDAEEAEALEALARYHPDASMYDSLSDLLEGEEFDAAVVMLPSERGHWGGGAAGGGGEAPVH